MAKKQTRRSISVSRVTYERLKSFCEASNISMSQFVETRVGDFLGASEGDLPVAMPKAATERPDRSERPAEATAAAPRPAAPMTSAAARYAVDPPLPIIKPKQEAEAPKAPKQPTAREIFTF